jgi:hypothetical protein
MAHLSRRAFLAIVALLTSVVRPGAAGAQAPAAARVSLDEFVELSERLLGRSKLDRAVAQVYLNALMSDADTAIHLATLVQSNGNPTPEQSAVARTTIEWWYTGVYTINGASRVATHTGALMWATLGMTAPGTCSGPFGAWSQPPRPVA